MSFMYLRGWKREMNYYMHNISSNLFESMVYFLRNAQYLSQDMSDLSNKILRFI